MRSRELLIQHSLSLSPQTSAASAKTPTNKKDGETDELDEEHAAGLKVPELKRKRASERASKREERDEERDEERARERERQASLVLNLSTCRNLAR
jgi:hypothetical protein